MRLIERLVLTVAFATVGIGALLYGSAILYLALFVRTFDDPTLWNLSNPRLQMLLGVPFLFLFGVWCLVLAVSTVVNSLPKRR